MKMYESEARKQVQTAREASLWLWKAHNRVSLRVAREGNADVDRRWPPPSMCFNCWKANIISRRLSLGASGESKRQLLSWNFFGSSEAESEPEPSGPYDWNQFETVFDLDNTFHYILYTYVGEQYLQVEHEERE